MTLAEATAAVRRHIEGSVQGGPGEMLREFKAFRFKSGSANNTVTFEEFEHGLKHMGIEIPHSIARQFFDHLDETHDGAISYTEFVHGVLGIKDVQTSLTKDGLGKEHGKGLEEAKKWRDAHKVKGPQLRTLEDAREAVRQHIEGSVYGGAAQMLRAFKSFRMKSGSATNEISFDEFVHGLKILNVEMPRSTARQFFDHLDTSHDGAITYTEFVSGILGNRGSEEQTSLTKGGLGKEHGHR